MSDSPNRKQPHILVLYNENPTWPQSDLDWTAEYVDIMTGGLREQGYQYDTLKFYADLHGLDDYDPAEWLVFNWGEELNGQAWSESLVADALDARGFAYTGCPGAVLRACQNRMNVKERLAAAGLPTLPARVFSDPSQAAAWTHFPAIVKGNSQHASYGIDGNAIVDNTAELARRITFLRENFNDDALVEPFLDSREFHVAVWGNEQPEALPPLEYDFSLFTERRDRIYTIQWKFDRESVGFKDMHMPCPAPLDRPDWMARLKEIAVAAYGVLGMRDYGRLDFRMLGDEPQVLDANPNPDLDVTSVLPTGARALGLTFGQMIDHILQSATARMPAA